MKCSQGRKYLTKIVSCSGFTGSFKVDEEVALNGDVIKKVAKFLHLGKVLSSKGEVQEAVICQKSAKSCHCSQL